MTGFNSVDVEFCLPQTKTNQRLRVNVSNLGTQFSTLNHLISRQRKEKSFDSFERKH